MIWKFNKWKKHNREAGWINSDSLTKEEHLKVYELSVEIREALLSWKTAEQKFEYACGHDEVELAIYQVMAAEQKYRLLLNKARKLDVDWSDVKGYVV